MKKIYLSLVRGFMRLLSKLPLKWLYGIGGAFAWFAQKVMHYRERVIMVNLARCFPEKKYWELDPIADAYYKHLGDIVAEAIWFGGSDYERIKKQKICRMTNPEVLNEAFNTSPSVVILNSHCGNWEILGGFCVYNEGQPAPYTVDNLCVVYKKLSNEVMDEVFKQNRTYCVPGFKGLVEASSFLRTALKNKDEKKIYISNSDQYPYVGRFFVGDFLNQPTYGMTGVVGVAHKMKMSVLAMKMVHKERGSYELTFVNLCNDASQHDPEDIVKMYYAELEKEINETPHNWLWSHKRWK